VRPAWLRFHDAAARLGAAPPEPPRLRLPEAVERDAEQFLREWGAEETGALVAIAPAAAWPTKEWPERRTLALAEHLLADGHRVLFVSTAAERARLTALDRCVAAEQRAAWCSSDLLRIGALLGRADAAVTADSGLMHLAAAAGTPVLALFGSTVPELGFAPAGAGHRVLGRELPCRPCAVHGRRRCPLGHFACLRELEQHVVRRELAAMLAALPPVAIRSPVR
jgi:ADP-heptose:LPS heptosyltransferase